MKHYVDSWLAHLEKRAPKPASPNTIRQYESKLHQFLAWLQDREPTPDVLFAYRMHRQTEGRRPRTIRVDFTAIYEFFEWLEEMGHAQGLPRTGAIQLPSMDEAQREKATDVEVEKLFAAAAAMANHNDRKRYLRGRALCILALLAGAGMRRAELLALDVRDIRQEKNPWHVHVRVGKGAQPRLVPIGEETRTILEEWLATRTRWCHQHGHTSDALIPVDSLRRLGDRGLMDIWAELLALAGITRRLTPHSLRHWFGTTTSKAVDLPTAQKMLGHKRLETTFQYLGTNAEKMEQAAQAIRFTRSTPPVSDEKCSTPPPEPPRREPSRQDRRPMRRETIHPRRRFDP